ncbi:MAG: hypothetical protein K0S81_2774 [Rhodospirillales bacterium]|jgi:hypothetical protein|nr:hypothetical protein [Rhodospirillales bacterium]
MIAPAPRSTSADWPGLPLSEWDDTRATLHLWTQIVGKVRLAQAPLINHWWQVPLYVTARGLTTSAMPYGAHSFQMEFDFIDHQLLIATSRGQIERIALQPSSVADFHREVMARLRALGLEVRIWTMPVELENPVAFERDEAHASYDAVAAHRFWRALVHVDRVLTAFRARFLGKVSPVHFFWGSFDMAVTRFSGRRAPTHPGAANIADFVTREAYSHECSSCGFWLGGPGMPEAAFYAYAYPTPAGFDSAPVRPAGAYFHQGLSEFILPYEAVRRAEDPDAALMQFLQSTYEAAADLGGWDRAALERPASD